MKENRDIAWGKKNVMSVAAAWTAQGSIKTSIRTVLQMIQFQGLPGYC